MSERFLNHNNWLELGYNDLSVVSHQEESNTECVLVFARPHKYAP